MRAGGRMKFGHFAKWLKKISPRCCVIKAPNAALFLCGTHDKGWSHPCGVNEVGEGIVVNVKQKVQ